MNALSRCNNSDWLAICVKKKKKLNMSYRSITGHSLPPLSLYRKFLMWFVQIVREQAVCVECCCKFSWMSLCLLHHHRGSALICWDRNTVWHRLGSTARTPSDRGGLIRHEIFTQTSTHTRTPACTHTQAHNSVVSYFHVIACKHVKFSPRPCRTSPSAIRPFVVHKRSNQLHQKMIY